MILYAYRSVDGLYSEVVFLTPIKPIFKDGRFYNPYMWITPVAFCTVYKKETALLYLKEGECKVMTLKSIRRILDNAGMKSDAIEQLEEFVKAAKEEQELDMKNLDLLTTPTIL